MLPETQMTLSHAQALTQFRLLRKRQLELEESSYYRLTPYLYGDSLVVYFSRAYRKIFDSLKEFATSNGISLKFVYDRTNNMSRHIKKKPPAKRTYFEGCTASFARKILKGLYYKIYTTGKNSIEIVWKAPRYKVYSGIQKLKTLSAIKNCKSRKKR